MEFEWWSWSLSVVGVTVQFLAGRAPRWAWILGFWSQVPWCVFAVVTDQWGFLPSSLLYASVYALHWRTERRRRVLATPSVQGVISPRKPRDDREEEPDHAGQAAT